MKECYFRHIFNGKNLHFDVIGEGLEVGDVAGFSVPGDLLLL